MAKIFCIANQKGGVGKTTASAALALAQMRAGRRVVVVTIDPGPTPAMFVARTRNETIVPAATPFGAQLNESAVCEEETVDHDVPPLRDTSTE